MTDAQIRATKKYAEKTTRISLQLCPPDSDLINWLNDKPNKSAVLKSALRHEMEREQADA